MRSLFITCAIGALLALPGTAQANTIIRCELCRSPYVYPMDYGNHVYNQTFGSDPTLTLDQASRVIVANPAGQWAVVDIDIVLVDTGVLAELGWFGISLSIPDGRLQISVQDPAGTMTDYMVFLGSPDLDVGDTPAITPTDGETTTSSGDDSSTTAPADDASTNDGSESTASGIETTTSLGPADYGQQGTWYWYQDTWSSPDSEWDYQPY